MGDMKRRFTLYGFGFFIGVLLVFFFLGGKNAACNWMPNDRMLKIIRSKEIRYTEETKIILNTTEIDSAAISKILIDGNIDFSKSKVKNDPCRKYWIDGANLQEAISLQVQVCDSVATIEEIIFKER